MGMPKEQWYSAYTFRHTWGTVAQNDCGATIAEVAFAMNHSHGYTVTRGYLRIDFTPAWELNAKVIDFILYALYHCSFGIPMLLQSCFIPVFTFALNESAVENRL